MSEKGFRCPYCGKGRVTYVRETYITYLKYVGEFIIYNALLDKCDKCKGFLIPNVTAERISVKVREKVEKFMQNAPFKDLWTLRQTYTYLGLTREKFHRSPQYHHFIWKTMKDGQTFFHSRCVKKFKRTGDGRFNI